VGRESWVLGRDVKGLRLAACGLGRVACGTGLADRAAACGRMISNSRGGTQPTETLMWCKHPVPRLNGKTSYPPINYSESPNVGEMYFALYADKNSCVSSELDAAQ